MFKKKNKGSAVGDEECMVCRGRGGLKSRGVDSGKIIRRPCPRCGKMPD